MTDGRQVDPDPEVRRKRRADLGVEHLRYYEDRVLAFARANGIPSLGLSRAFLARAEETGYCLHGFANAQECDGHWNERGHRLAGEVIATKVCDVVSSGTP